MGKLLCMAKMDILVKDLGDDGAKAKLSFVFG